MEETIKEERRTEEPEKIKSDKQIIYEWKLKIKRLFEIAEKKKINEQGEEIPNKLSVSQIKECYECLFEGIINNYISVNEQLYYLKKLYNFKSYVEDENLPQERINEKKQYDTYKEIIYEKIQELETNQIKKMPQNQIINTYMKIKEYYNETIEILKKRGKISIDEFKKIYNVFIWAYESDNKIKNIRPDVRPDFRIDYNEWARKILAISETHVIIYTLKDLAIYKEKLNQFIEENKEKQRH